VNNRLVFFKEFLKHPLQIGGIIPSSKFLEQRLLEISRVDSANTIVELGSGTGSTTRAILRAMPKSSRLLVVEINPFFHKLVSNINDDRFIAHLGNACRLKEIISIYGLAAPDTIISGIPFSTMSQSTGSHILEAVSSLLVPNGRFVAYQASKRVASLCRPLLGPEQMTLELLNIPPMRVYKWRKGDK